VNHFRETQAIHPPKPGPVVQRVPNLRLVEGREHARRVLEIAAPGGHNLLIVGSPLATAAQVL
jgi:predicted ATPase with chaperone activity